MALVTHLQEALETKEVLARQSQRLLAYVHTNGACIVLQLDLNLRTFLVHSFVETPALNVAHSFQDFSRQILGRFKRNAVGSHDNHE